MQNVHVSNSEAVQILSVREVRGLTSTYDVPVLFVVFLGKKIMAYVGVLFCYFVCSSFLVSWFVAWFVGSAAFFAWLLRNRPEANRSLDVS